MLYRIHFITKFVGGLCYPTAQKNVRIVREKYKTFPQNPDNLELPSLQTFPRI